MASPGAVHPQGRTPADGDAAAGAQTGRESGATGAGGTGGTGGAVAELLVAAAEPWAPLLQILHHICTRFVPTSWLWWCNDDRDDHATHRLVLANRSAFW